MKLIKKWAKGELVLFLIAVAVVIAAGCQKDDAARDPVPNTDMSEPAPIESQVYTVVGKVRSITPDRDFVMIRHDAIEGFMDAMTMPFAVADTNVITGLAAGDSVRFEIMLADGNVTITSLEVQ